MTSTLTDRPVIVGLHDSGCLEPHIVGGKAAALARSASAGLPVFDALVLTTGFTELIDSGSAIADQPAVDAIIEHFGDIALVVRSSSTAEDLAASSMAGRFESVLDVRGREALVAAIRIVLASRGRASEGSDLRADHPIAVLVQPFSASKIGGVLFGVDPVSGRSDRLVVAAGSNPEEIVSGTADGVRNELDLDGNVVDDAGTGAGELLSAGLRRSLADLARRTAVEFGGPQDMEWLVDAVGELRLLQSRPVTTTIRGVPQGPLYGPGPVAETFPDALSVLERDLWVPPLRDAMREALVLAGALTRKELADRPIVVAPGGRVALDLEVTGEVAPSRRTLWQRISPRPGYRKLRSSWRIGRLRTALPEIALDIINRTDHELRGVLDLAQLSDRQLVALLERSQRVLLSVHAHEVLMGLIIDHDAPEITGASVALRVLSEGRRDGRTDAAIVAENPIVLSLVAPRIGPGVTLPHTPEHLPPARRADEAAGVAGLRREALRLRSRWVQELMGRAAWEMAERMAANGQIDEPELARHMHLDDLRLVFLRWADATGLRAPDTEIDPLPGTFRLSDTGMPIAVRRPGVADEAVGGGGGTGSGPVTHDFTDPPPGSVLVVTTLRPDIAPILSRLNGLVAETGSPLAHLAILAREAGIATVVSVTDAVNRYPEGRVVHVDGLSGQVSTEVPS